MGEVELELELGGGTSVRLDRHQLATADIRLAYVQHPFPAQGLTTDTTHLIIAEHATAEGSYVALTRARQQTHLYATRDPETEDDVASLAERMSRTEPDLPSIATPLAHETVIINTTNRDGEPTTQRIADSQLHVDHGVEHDHTSVRPWPGLDSDTDRTCASTREPEPPRAADLGWEP